MHIKDVNTYNNYDARIEELLHKGSVLGGMDLLSEEEKEELSILSDAAYEWECDTEPHPWKVKPSLIAAIKVAFRKKGIKQKDAAKAIGVSPTALSDILHGRRAISYDIARNIYHELGVPANIVLA
ncbi:helix-turn-helix transcriptional regulator [uncultured Prevotella sp.]|uniref:helix-turn-helix transcriptional regulator n=1 Tax=uncultured Prevotella sp. TaxID=159272 RepID=UPI0025D8C07E|nr:helix-turn-helix transcriptional regulator [uncultured Prevotella sp.]